MLNRFCKYNLWDISVKLSNVAMGREPADKVIRNGKLVNVCTREIMTGVDIAIAYGRVALVGDASHCIGKDTLVIDAGGKYVSPAFMDGHMHIESSMMSASEYAKAVLPHGTCAVFYDPHEICNVLGMDGVKEMSRDIMSTPLKGMLTIPSCVPAVPGFEDTGASIDYHDIAEGMRDIPNAIGLGEMMNFPGILYGAEPTHAIVGETLKADGIVTGHYSVPDTGMGLNAYISSGVRCCHESTRREDALAKMRLGMYAMLREGSAWHDLEEVSHAIVDNEVDSRFATLISDDNHPNTLKTLGHLDHILRRAVECGIDPIVAIQMVTINCAECFKMADQLGSITPSKCADIVLLEDLKDFKVAMTMIDGDIVAQDGKLTIDIPHYKYPDKMMHTINVGRDFTEEDFKIKSTGDKRTVRVIEVIPAKTSTYERHISLPVVNGEVVADTTQDVLKAVVFERHNATGKAGYGFVKGFGIDRGAIASTVAHDAHNLFVVGTNDSDMALAARELVKVGGGQCVVKDGKVLSILPLPIAGLMSDKPLDEVASTVASIERAWKEVNCNLPSPFMTMAIIPLACLPVLRLTDRGLVDCNDFCMRDLFVD